MTCRAPVTFKAAFEYLTDARRTKHYGTELLNAAEAYLRQMYLLIKSDPASRFLDPVAAAAFLKAAEAYYAEAGEPLPQPPTP
ncbi:hypothetical protein [Gemmata sp.]|uniref:hypothetical protein n=1 Tax=Gemmata sp. TaxID=1914242 RepID=UPI003F6FC552